MTPSIVNRRLQKGAPLKGTNFESIASSYDATRTADMTLANRIVADGNLTPSSSVLEVGCGTGNYCSLIATNTGARVVGLDRSPSMLAQARAKIGTVEFYEGDATLLRPFNKNEFDLVYLIDVVHHITRLNRLFKHIARVSKPGGKTIVVTVGHDTLRRSIITRYFPETLEPELNRYHPVAKLESAMSAAGLNAIEAVALALGEKPAFGADLLRIAQNRTYSVFSMVPASSIAKGIARLSEDLRRGGVPYTPIVTYLTASKTRALA